MRRCASVAMTVMLALGLTFGPALSTQAYYVQPVTTTSQHFASEIDRLIDVQRARYHLPAYGYSACAYKYANTWAAYLASTGTFYHRPDLSVILTGCNATRAGETLARGYNHASTLVAAWMASPGHRAVLLDTRLTATGVAARYANGQWTVAANYVR